MGVVYGAAHLLKPKFNSIVVKDDNSHANGSAKAISQGKNMDNTNLIYFKKRLGSIDRNEEKGLITKERSELFRHNTNC